MRPENEIPSDQNGIKKNLQQTTFSISSKLEGKLLLMKHQSRSKYKPQYPEPLLRPATSWLYFSESTVSQ